MGTGVRIIKDVDIDKYTTLRKGELLKISWKDNGGWYFAKSGKTYRQLTIGKAEELIEEGKAVMI